MLEPLLRTLSWNMGACVPETILGPGGYLAQHQTRLEEIKLVTEGMCQGDGPPFDLSPFVQLRKFGWTGMQSRTDMKTLARILARVSHQLLELELDFCDGNPPKRDMELTEEQYDEYFTRRVLGLSRGDEKCFFPVIQVLSLTHIPFASMAEELACAFDFGDLRALKIQLCDGWEGFLLTAGRVSCLDQLESLDIHTNYLQDMHTHQVVSDFLGSFQSLRKLAVATSASWATSDLWAAANHHKATLKALVHRTSSLSDEYENMEYRRRGRKKTMYSSEHLVDVGLEFLAVNCSPESILVKYSWPTRYEKLTL
jgi:hypothetical protein